jgi:hypothetical protein
MIQQSAMAGVLTATDTVRSMGYNNNNNNNIYLTAIGLSPGGSGFTHIYKYLTLCFENLHLHRRGGYMRSM